MTASSNIMYVNVQQRTGAFLLNYLIVAAYLVLLSSISVGLAFGPLGGVFRALIANPNRSELSAFPLFSETVNDYTASAKPEPLLAVYTNMQ